MSFYKEVPGRKTTLESTLKFDTAPTAGSTNPVTSDGIAAAITEAVGGASDAIQEQIDDIAEKAGSGYTPKGPASVATLNGLSGQENGWLYTMTDAGTLTDGSLAVTAGDTVAWDATNSVWYKAMDYAPRQYGTNEIKNLTTTITSFRTGDVIPVDGPSGTAKMLATDLLRETAENAGREGYVNKSNFSSANKYPLIGCDLISSNGNVVHPYEHTDGTRTNLTGFVQKFNSYSVSASSIDTDGKVYEETWWKIFYYQVKKGDVVCLYANTSSFISMGFNTVVPSIGDTISSYIGRITLTGTRTISLMCKNDGYFLFSAHVGDVNNFKVSIGKLDDSIGIKANREYLNIYDKSSVTWNKYISSDGSISSTSGWRWGVTDYIPLYGQDITFTPVSPVSSIANAVVYDEHFNIVKVVPNGVNQLEWRPGYYCVRVSVIKTAKMFINYGLWDDLTTYLNNDKKPFLDDVDNGLKTILRNAFNIAESNGFYRDYEHDKVYAYRNSASAFDAWTQFESKITDWTGTKIVIEFDLDIVTGSNGTSFGLWVTDGYSSSYVEGHQDKLADITESGHYRYEIDTAYYAVYRNWTEFNFWLVYSGITHDSAVDNRIELTNVYVWSYTSDYAEFNNFAGNNLKELLKGIDASIDDLTTSQSKSDFIVSPNGTKFIQSIDNSGNIFGIPLYPNKSVFIGNSLLVGNSTFGMNASDYEHDYYHYLTDFIAEKKQSATFTKIYGSNLEHSTTLSEARDQIATIVNNIPADADFVQIQMGDNVNTDTKLEVFHTSCSELITAVRTKAQRARIVWVGTWYNSAIRSFIANTCTSLGVQWIPIGSFNTTENQSYVGAVIHRSESATRTLADVTNVTEVSSGRISVTFTVGANSYMSELDVSAWSITGTTLTYTSEYSITDSTGVATHPGNNGFRLIANKILFDTKMSESENTYPAEE